MSLKAPKGSDLFDETYDLQIDISEEQYQTLLDYEGSEVKVMGDKKEPTVFVSIYSADDPYNSNISARAIYNESTPGEPHLSVIEHEAVDGTGDLDDLGPVAEILSENN